MAPRGVAGHVIRLALDAGSALPCSVSSVTRSRAIRRREARTGKPEPMSRQDLLAEQLASMALRYVTSTELYPAFREWLAETAAAEGDEARAAAFRELRRSSVTGAVMAVSGIVARHLDEAGVTLKSAQPG